ncbi:hypothetical protein BBJ28_00025794 [Nothophytophthora sp. Chile5]|nr:hypothetical protein BBJ28_00025794 [Nothophytophthora sp. Chile5]
MWLNSRELAGDDDGTVARDGVWSFASPPSSSSHGVIGGSASRALWNRMEPAEEEREEEALPSYLSYLQPAFRPAPTTPTTLAPTSIPAPAPSAFYTAKRGAPGLTPPLPMAPSPALSPSLPAPPPSLAPDGVGQVARKSSELALALEHLVLGSLQQRLGPGVTAGAAAGAGNCSCSCEAMRVHLAELSLQVQALQTQVLELAKPSVAIASETTRSSSTSNSGGSSNWSANAPPFVPKQQPYASPAPSTPPPLSSTVEPSAATVLSDRISTLEGRQSAFQSQLAQIAKVLGVPSGKPGKHSPVKHLVQTLRDEVDAKVQEATELARTELTAEIDAALAGSTTSKRSSSGQESSGNDVLTSDVVLAALAGEHEASLARLSDSFEQLLAQEGRQRAALDARVRAQLAQQEEWLQQLEGAFGGSRHDPEHEQEAHESDSNGFDSQRNVATKLAALERKCDESLELWRRLAQRLPAVESMRPDEEEEEEEGLSWPGHMVNRA